MAFLFTKNDSLLFERETKCCGKKDADYPGNRYLLEQKMKKKKKVESFEEGRENEY